MHFLQTASLALLALLGTGVAARSAGCGKSPISGGVKSMTVNGKTRQYTLAVPSNYNPNTAYKVVFGFHWLNGNMQAVVNGQYYGLLPLSGGSTIFVAPNGLNAGWANQGGEDIKFTDQLLDFAKTNLCIDEKQVFATGWSYGGSMSFSLACSRPTVFKAVAAIAGAQLSGCSGGNTPVAYLGIHGAADDVLPIGSGRQLRDKFLGLNGCASKNAPEPSAGQGNHIKTVYSCRAGYPVWWIAHGGGHVPDPKDSGSGSSWAPAEVWSFFTQAELGGPGGGTSSTSRPPPGSTSTATPTSTSSAPGTSPTGSCSSLYGQCGGIGWAGPKCCSQGTCKFSNDWYSQCL
jgi:poly(3-hydroxybutyrate) depolymerase